MNEGGGVGVAVESGLRTTAVARNTGLTHVAPARPFSDVVRVKQNLVADLKSQVHRYREPLCIYSGPSVVPQWSLTVAIQLPRSSCFADLIFV